MVYTNGTISCGEKSWNLNRVPKEGFVSYTQLDPTLKYHLLCFRGDVGLTWQNNKIRLVDAYYYSEYSYYHCIHK